MTTIEEQATKLRTEMLEAEISNVLPDTPDGEDVIRNRHLWLIERALTERAEAERNRIVALYENRRAVEVVRSAVMGVPGWTVGIGLDEPTHVQIADAIARAACAALAVMITEQGGGE